MDDQELKDLNGLQKLFYIIKFTASSAPFLAVIIPLVIYFVWASCGADEKQTVWNSVASAWSDPTGHSAVFTGFGTLLIAFILWVFRLYKNWEDSLTSYVSAQFTYDRKPYFEIRYYYLAGEESSEIRQMPQS